MTMDQREIDELIEAYAFGILDDAERTAMERFLDTGDENALHRMREAGEVSVRLAAAVAQKSPPAYVREQVMQRVRTAARRAGVPVAGAYVEAGVRGAAASVEQPRVAVAAPSTRDMVARLRVAWTSAALAAMAAAFFIWQTTALRERVQDLNVTLNVTESEAESIRAELADAQRRISMGDPGMRFVTLQGVDPNPDAVGWVVMRPTGDSGIAYMYDFPLQAAGRAYQLWAFREERVASMGMFTVSESGHAVLSIPKIEDADCITGFAVTIEPSTGVDAPKGMVYVRGDNRFRDAH